MFGRSKLPKFSYLNGTTRIFHVKKNSVILGLLATGTDFICSSECQLSGANRNSRNVVMEAKGRQFTYILHNLFRAQMHSWYHKNKANILTKSAFELNSYWLS